MINSKKKGFTNVKGFTVVELVIVIAVIAVLAAVLIPTFSNLVRKANVSSDTALVKNLNTALAVDTNEHNTMGDALAAAKEFGYDITKINAKANGNEILWDSKNDCFVYLDRENSEGLIYIPDTKVEEPEDYELWVIYDEAHPTYSTYLYNCTKTSIDTSKGIDTSEAPSVKTINYTNSGEAQSVTICTNSAEVTLNINAPNDVVNHFGILSQLNVIAIANDCFYEFGQTAYAKIDSGKIVINKGGQISVLFATNSAVQVSENEGNVLSAYCESNDSKPTDTNVTFNVATKEEIAILGDKAKQDTLNEFLSNNNNVARIDQVSYVSLQAAIDDAAYGAEIVVLKDIKLTSPLNVSDDKYLILNTNGKSISPENYNLEDLIVNNGKLSITGGGTLNSGKLDVIYNFGELTIGGNCTFVGESVQNGAISLIYNKGTLNISSGTFDKDGLAANATIENVGNNASLVISGGTFSGCTIINIVGCRKDIIISGGTFVSDANISNMGNQYMINIGLDEYGTSSTGKLTIKGGSFSTNGETGKYLYGLIHKYEDSNISIEGGSYQFDPSEFVDGNSYTISEANSIYTVTKK